MQVNLTMDGPKTVNANYSMDYTILVVPAIVALGAIVLLASIILILLHRRQPEDAGTETGTETVTAPAAETVTEPETPTCPNCGKPIEKEWAHCIKCGAKLTNNSPNKSGAGT